MGTKELRKRESWQDTSGPKAEQAENDFEKVFKEEFKGSEFNIRDKPKEFNSIYSKIELSKEVLEEIYTPEDGYGPHGIKIDYAIDNIKTGKTLYVEVKRQDGWIGECTNHKTDTSGDGCNPSKNTHHKYCGLNPAAGRGNAHERSCKFFTPGLLKILREHGNLDDNVLPFWTVYIGGIARDPKRVREISCWYDGYTAHFFMWINSDDGKPLIDHFNNNLKHLLL